MSRTAKLADLAAAYDSGGGFGFKNRLINSDMRIDQRNAGASVTLTAATYTLDRWNSQVAVSSTFSIARSNASLPTGFTRTLLVTSLAATSVGSTASNTVEQYVEGFNSADFGWGAAGAQSVTLSFWVRSSLTGTFGGCFQNSDNSRSYVFSYSISASNTWEYKTVTIVGDTSGTWNTENGIGIKLRFSLGNGSTLQGSAGSWSGSNLRTVTGETQVLATNTATWQVTGVQLEKGSTATSFDYRPYGTELQLAQRYYYKIFPNANSQSAFGVGFNESTTLATLYIAFPTNMRIAPTALDQSGTAGDYAVRHSGGGVTACSAVPAFNTGSISSAIATFTVASGLTAGAGSFGRTGSSTGTNAYLGWSAEL
jgi:hypothetical protein